MTRREENIVIARNFHYRYEQLAPFYRWSTNDLSRVPWDDLPDNQRELMLATIGALRQDGVITFNPQQDFLDVIGEGDG